MRFGYLQIAIAGIFTLTFCGCSAGYKAYTASGGGAEAAIGEQHDTPYSARDTLATTEDVLRGEGVLFQIQPDDKLETLWRQADKPAGMFASAVGVDPQYRYVIEIVPTGQRTSRIVANVEVQDIADDEIASYLPSKKLNLFNKFDQLATQYPPPSSTPRAQPRARGRPRTGIGASAARSWTRSCSSRSPTTATSSARASA